MHALAALTLSALAAAPATNDTPITLSFGVYPSDKATVMYKQFTPVLEHLTADIEKRTGRPADIQLTIFPSYDAGIDALVHGTVDFVRFGPAPYITAKARQPGLELIAMETEGGDTTFKGVIIVRKDSPYRTLADLRGHSFAFGDPNSTIGRYLAQAELRRAGLFATDLSSYKYLNRHDTVAKAVEIGDFDAGSVKIETFNKANANNTLRVLASFDNVTKPWVARKGLDRSIRETIAASLFALKDESALKELKVSGFIPTTDESYQPTRDGMKAAEEFENPSIGN